MNPNALSVALVALILGMSTVSAHEPDAVETPQEPAYVQKAQVEVKTHYAKAHPEVQEYVLWTARQFGHNDLWQTEDALKGLSEKERNEKVKYLAKLLEEAEYGRHLCRSLAEASAIVDKRLVPGLMKVAAYHRDDRDYDCRPKWMAVAALARQNSDAAVPLLISLVDHGNQNTRFWARAALARKAKQDLKQDKQAWAKWWQEKGHDPIEEKYLKPWQPVASVKK